MNMNIAAFVTGFLMIGIPVAIVSSAITHKLLDRWDRR